MAWLNRLWKWLDGLIVAFMAKAYTSIPEAPESPVEPVLEPAPSPVTIPPNPDPMPTIQKTKREHLYDVAKASIGFDMSPKDLAPDALACAESLNGVFQKAFGEPIGTGAALVGTNALYKTLLIDPRFEKTLSPLPGDIVISPTGYSSKGAQHGHCGIRGFETYMSNDSDTGKWKANYTLAAWYNVFNVTLGFPVVHFRVRE